MEWRTDMPDESTKEPILVKRKGAFKYGLLYKLSKLDDDGWPIPGTKFWRLHDGIIEWAEIRE